MGKEVITAINNQSEKFQIVCGFDKDENNLGFPVYNDWKNKWKSRCNNRFFSTCGYFWNIKICKKK